MNPRVPTRAEAWLQKRSTVVFVPPAALTTFRDADCRVGKRPGPAAATSVALEAQVGEGDTMDASVKDGTIVVGPNRRTYSLEKLVAKITPRNRRTESDGGIGDEHGSPRIHTRGWRSGLGDGGLSFQGVTDRGGGEP